MKKTSLSILLIVTLGLAMLSACGGGSSSSPQPPYQPTSAVLTLLTSGITTTIYGIEVTVVLPDGVTAKSTAAPPMTDNGVVTATGSAAGAEDVTGNYTPAASPAKGTVLILISKSSGFGTGEYSTVSLDIVTANTPTSGGFSLTNFKPVDDQGHDIVGLTPAFTASIR